MINFIIYDGSKNTICSYEKIIFKLCKERKIDYIIDYVNNSNYNSSSIYDKKIYIVNIDFEIEDGFNFIKSIRDNGDWISQIVIVSDYNYKNINLSIARLLVLDYISRDIGYEERLYNTLDIAIGIFNKNSILSFKSNNQIVQLMYDEIYYIEKNLNDNDATVITKNDSYIIRNSINKILDLLNNDNRFFKTHRSCIVNLNNVRCFDMKNNVIKFDLGETNLISRNNRKKLKDIILGKNGLF